MNRTQGAPPSAYRVNHRCSIIYDPAFDTLSQRLGLLDPAPRVLLEPDQLHPLWLPHSIVPDLLLILDIRSQCIPVQLRFCLGRGNSICFIHYGNAEAGKLTKNIGGAVEVPFQGHESAQ